MERFWRRFLCVAALSLLFLIRPPVVYAAGSDCSHVYETITEAATCTDPGVAYDKCTLCGKTTNYVNIPAAGHSFGEWTVTEEPSCSGAGLEVRRCSSCGYQEERLLEALGHFYGSADVPPTCGKQGYTLYTCSVCEDSYKSEYVDALGHSYGSSVLSPTCTKQGYTVFTCGVCGDSYKSEYVDALGHSYGSSVLSPSCTKQGYTVFNCGVCGDSYKSDYVDALGHSYISSVISPTCEKQGYTHHVCEKCGEAYKSDYLDPLGHCYTAQVVAPTRTARGYTLYICGVCQDSYKAEYVAATGSQTSASTEMASSQTTEPEQAESESTEPTSADPANSAEGQTSNTNSGGRNNQQETTTAPVKPVQVSTDRWYVIPVRWLRDRSTEPVVPLPNGNLTRAQFVTLLWRCCGSPEPSGNICPYADLKADESCRNAVLWACELGIARGIDARRFAPNTIPARRQVVSMLYWVFGEP